MKKLWAILFMLLFVASSYALELKANGSYRIRMFNTWGGGGSDYGMDRGGKQWNFGNVKDGDDDDQFFDQRFRLKLTADNGDGIRGVVMFEMGDAIWGDHNSYARLGADDGGDSDVEVLNAYIEIDKWFYTKAGVFTFDTPNSAILSEELAGVLVGKDFDNFAVNLLYSKLYDGGNDSRGYDNNDDADLAGIMVPVKTNYFNVTPYFLYSHIGYHGELDSADHYGNMVRLYQGHLNSGLNVNNSFSLMGREFLQDSFHQNYKDADAWWVGAAFDGKIPYANGIDWKLHGVYGSANVNARHGKDLEMQGFLIDGSLTYVLDKYKFDVYGLVSPGFDAGDYKGHELDMIPTVAPDYMVYGTYAPMFFDALGMGCFTQDPSGWSMVGGQVTFNSIERLKHIIDVAYIWNMIGSGVAEAANVDKNDNANYRYMFDDFIEAAIVNEYQIAEGTTLSMLTGILKPLDTNSYGSSPDTHFEKDVAAAVNFMLQYNF
jgi:hypothetical protein